MELVLVKSMNFNLIMLEDDMVIQCLGQKHHQKYYVRFLLEVILTKPNTII